MAVDREALQVPPSLELAVTYTREVGAGVERIWENCSTGASAGIARDVFQCGRAYRDRRLGVARGADQESRYARSAHGPRDAGGPRGRPIPRADPRRRRRGDRDLDIAEGAGTASDGRRSPVLSAGAGPATARRARRQIPRQLRTPVGRGRGDDDAARGNDDAHLRRVPAFREARSSRSVSRAATAAAAPRRIRRRAVPHRRGRRRDAPRPCHDLPALAWTARRSRTAERDPALPVARLPL